jgi:hypothetical protein
MSVDTLTGRKRHAVSAPIDACSDDEGEDSDVAADMFMQKDDPDVDATWANQLIDEYMTDGTSEPWDDEYAVWLLETSERTDLEFALFALDRNASVAFDAFACMFAGRDFKTFILKSMSLVGPLTIYEHIFDYECKNDQSAFELARDREFVLTLLRELAMQLKEHPHLNEEFDCDGRKSMTCIELYSDDAGVQLALGACYRRFYPLCSSKLSRDTEFLREAALIDPEVLWDLDSALMSDREFVLSLLNAGVACMRYTDENLRDDCEITLAAVKVDASELDFAFIEDQDTEMYARIQSWASLSASQRRLRKWREWTLAWCVLYGWQLSVAKRQEEARIAEIDNRNR